MPMKKSRERGNNLNLGYLMNGDKVPAIYLYFVACIYAMDPFRINKNRLTFP